MQIYLYMSNFCCNFATAKFDMIMDSKGNARNRAVRRLLYREAQKEAWGLWLLALSFIYVLVSNLLIHCPPLPLCENVLDVMDSIDETVRNCFYGLIAAILFYLLNDFYKNVYKKVDLYNEMYPFLYKLWLKTYQLVLALNNHKLDESQTNEELLSSIISNLCGISDKEASFRSKSEISANMVHLLYGFWSDIQKDKEKFLKVYSEVITKEEYFKLNDKELDTSVERLKEYCPNDNQITSGKKITIRDYDILRAIYLILNFKLDLAAMVNKYSIYYYSNASGVRKDAF